MTCGKRHLAFVVMAAIFFEIALLSRSAAQDGGELWTAYSGTTSIAFNQEYLAGLGIEVEVETSSAEPYDPGDLGFGMVPPSELQFSADRGVFTALHTGYLHHSGGFVLRLADGGISLMNFVIRVVGRYDFELLDAQGNRWFLLRDYMMEPSRLMDPSRESRELEFFWMSLLVAPELAQRVGLPDLENAVLGHVDISLRAEPPELSARQAIGGISVDLDHA